MEITWHFWAGFAIGYGAVSVWWYRFVLPWWERKKRGGA